ncbi:hypothetical protein D3C71_2144340 [compost metagenome]
MYKIGRPVNRINNPEILMLPSFFQGGGQSVSPWLNAFFPENGMVGIMGQDQPADHLLHAFVHFCNQILG